MTKDFIGDEKFQKGLQNYLIKYKYGNAESKDLYDCLGEEVGTLMDNWTKQKGYPLVTLHKNNKISQKRFTLLESEDESFWKIPVKIKWIHGNETDETSYLYLKEKDLVFEPKTEIFKINSDCFGFYRVFYEDEKVLEKLFKSSLNDKDKLGLLNDLYALTIGRYYKIEIPMKYSQFFINEKNFEVLATVVGCLNGIRSKLKIGSDNYELIKSLTLKLLHHKIDPTREYDDINENALTSFVLDERVYNDDEETINKLLNVEVAPAFRSSKFIAEAKKYGMEVYEKLIKIYQTSNIPDERSAAVAALGHCGLDSINKLLEDLPKRIKLQDSIYVYHGLISNRKIRTDVIINIIEKWPAFLVKFADNYDLLGDIVETIFYKVNSETWVAAEKFLTELEIDEMQMARDRLLEEIKIVKEFLKYNNEEM